MEIRETIRRPEFPRPYKHKTDSELVGIVKSFPRDDRLSERINWENRMTYAYAEIGIRTMEEK
jgi:hypothetical protein